MSPNSIKKKCQAFLSSLIKFAGDQGAKTASNVNKLIQSLIDGTIEPEKFSTEVERELIPQFTNLNDATILFLKNSLPHVRQSLMTKEMTIDGIRPPPLPAASVQRTASTTVATPAQKMPTSIGITEAIQIGPGGGRGGFKENNTLRPVSATSGHITQSPISKIGSSAALAPGMPTSTGVIAANEVGPASGGPSGKRDGLKKNNTPRHLSATSDYKTQPLVRTIGSSAAPAPGRPTSPGVTTANGVDPASGGPSGKRGGFIENNTPRPVSASSGYITQSPISTIGSSAASDPGMSKSTGVTTAKQVDPASGGPSGKRGEFKEKNNSLKRKCLEIQDNLQFKNTRSLVKDQESLTRVMEPANKKMLLNLENKIGFYERQIQMFEAHQSESRRAERQWKHDNDKLQMKIHNLEQKCSNMKTMMAGVNKEYQSKLKQAQDEATIRVHEVEHQNKIDMGQLQMKIHSLEQKCSNMEAKMVVVKSENAETVRKLEFNNLSLELSVKMLKEENEKSLHDNQILKREKIGLIEEAAKGKILEKKLKEVMDKMKMLKKQIKTDKEATVSVPS